MFFLVYLVLLNLLLEGFNLLYECTQRGDVIEEMCLWCFGVSWCGWICFLRDSGGMIVLFLCILGVAGFASRGTPLII